ncbi:MAG: outer membrane protein assembly factor BamB family protein [Thermoguttaceae bacterium]
MSLSRPCRIVPALWICAMLTPWLRGADWPRWCGHTDGNMISWEKGLPDSFEPGRKDPKGDSIDLATTRKVRWVAKLGSNAYGNPTVSQGRVFVGTDDLLLAEDSRFDRTKGGLLRCFSEKTGELLWQLATPVRTKGLHPKILFGHQHLGICSSPTVEGDRVYIVGSRGDVLCLDVEGQANGNAGPFTDEGRYMAGEDKAPIELGPGDGDIVWRYDPLDELGVCPHDAASCSILICGDVLYLSTSNGVDVPHETVLAPKAPAILALDKHSGRLVAREEIGLSSRLYHAQWSSPSMAEVGGRTLIFFGGGDGKCYAFAAIKGLPEKVMPLEMVWSSDCIPEEYKYRNGKLIPYYEGDKRKSWSTNKNDGNYVGPSQVIATPAFYKDRVYVSIGQDPAHGRGKGSLHCIDATGTGEITKTGGVWCYNGLDRSLSTVTIADGLVYAADVAGRLHCLDADTGAVQWVYDAKAETWGGALVADGKLFLGNKEKFLVLAAGRELKVLSQVRLGTPMYSTAIAANGVLYIASQKYLWAVAGED